MKIKKICVLGGTGFVGRHLVNRLAQDGYAIRVLTRHPHRHRGLLVLPDCELAECDVFDPGSLGAQLADCDAVVNLIGILNEGKRSTFERIHVDLVKNLTEVCHANATPRLLHMSALHADEARGASQYLRSKGKGENLAHTLGQPRVAVTSFRPSVIFGIDDSFVNRFAALLRLPGPLPLACPDARFAPVFVGDVVEAFALALTDRRCFDRHYDLCGPEVMRLEEIVRYVAAHLGPQPSGRKKWILRLPDGASRLQARLLEFAPGKPFTRDNYLSLQQDSVCQQDGLAELGIVPTPMSAVVPAFLQQRSARGHFNQLRRSG